MNQRIIKSLTERDLKEVMALYDIPLETNRLVMISQNATYNINESYALKMMDGSDRDLDQIEAQLDYEAFLIKHGIRIPCVYQTKDRQRIVVRDIGHDRVFFILMAWIEGKPLSRQAAESNAALIVQWGDLMGRMHALANSFPWTDKRFHYQDDPTLSHAESILSTHHPEMLKDYQMTLRTIQTCPKNANTYGMMHADMHQGNLLLCGKDLVVLDFDDCCYGYFMMDLAAAFDGYMADIPMGDEWIKDAMFFLKTIGEGYGRHIDDVIFFKVWFPVFLKYRYYILLIFFYESTDQSETWIKEVLDLIEGHEQLMSTLFEAFATM